MMSAMAPTRQRLTQEQMGNVVQAFVLVALAALLISGLSTGDLRTVLWGAWGAWCALIVRELILWRRRG